MSMMQMLLGAGGKSGPPVDEVFSTDLYTGTGVALDIDNGIDLLNEGGMVWTKARSGGSTYRWQVWTTARTRSKYMFLGSTASTDGETDCSSTGGITSFNSDGFSFGTQEFHENVDTKPSVAFTFREAEKFFDVVEYDGTNGSQSVAHNLGCVPGFMIVKRYNTAGSGWLTYHSGRTGGATNKMQKLNEDGSQESGTIYWNDTAPTSTHFTVGTAAEVNDGGGGYKYLCYLFAEDEDNIKCGYYDSTGATGNAINVGFEPQWLLVKAASASGGWSVIDTARGLTEQLSVNSNSAAGAVTSGNIVFTSTGFTLNTTGWINGTSYGSGIRYIYVAIKKEE